jgi:hypothetical protein
MIARSLRRAGVLTLGAAAIHSARGALMTPGGLGGPARSTQHFSWRHEAAWY